MHVGDTRRPIFPEELHNLQLKIAQPMPLLFTHPCLAGGNTCATRVTTTVILPRSLLVSSRFWRKTALGIKPFDVFTEQVVPARRGVRGCDSKLQIPTVRFPVDACAVDPDPSP